MYLTTATLKFGTKILNVFYGNFIDPKSIELVIVKINNFEIFGLKKNGKFGYINSIRLFKDISATSILRNSRLEKNYMITVYEPLKVCIIIINSKNIDLISIKSFETECNKIYSKGFFFAINDDSMVCMISFLRSKKIIFLIHIDENGVPKIFKNFLKIVHKETICFYLATLNILTYNIFACIESCKNKPYEKYLVFYIINIKSKFVKRRQVCEVPSSSYLLVPLSKKFNKGHCLLLFSKKSIEMIILEKNIVIKKNISSDLPVTSLQTRTFSSHAYFIGRKIDFLILGCKSGFLFKIDLFNNFLNNIKRPTAKINFLEKLENPIKTIKILPNGFLFTNMESGDHFCFQFTNFKKKQSFGELFYGKKNKFTNIYMIDRLSSLSKLKSLSLGKLEKNFFNQIYFLCSTSSSSSVIVLRRSYNLKKRVEKKFRKNPSNIFSVSRNTSLTYIIISYKRKSILYTMSHVFEQSNDTFLFTDSCTLDLKYMVNQKTMVQIAEKKIRSIMFTKAKKTVVNDFYFKNEQKIINSSFLICKKIFIILILDDNRIIISEILKTGDFLILKYHKLRVEDITSIIGLTIKNENLKKINSFFCFSKKEKFIRKYNISDKFSFSLTRIQFLPKEAVSGLILNHSNKNLLFLSLQNGYFLKSNINLETGDLLKISTKKICKKTKLFFIKNNKNEVFIYDKKVWLLDLSSSRIKLDIFCKKIFNCFEASENFYIFVKKKNLKIYHKNKFFLTITEKIKALIPFRAFDFGFFGLKNKIKLILFMITEQEDFNSNDGCFLIKNREKISRNNCRIKNICKNFISGFFLKNFISHHTYDNSKISDLVKLRSSHSKRFVNSFTSRISYKENEFLFLVTTRTVCETDGRKKPIKIIKEYHENTDSLLLFFLKKNLVFSPENGGRISKNYRIEFYKEKIFSGNDFSFFLIKKTFGNRFVFCHGNVFEILEIGKNLIRTIVKIKNMGNLVKNINFIRNRIYTINPIEGLKIFEFNSKQKKISLLGESAILSYHTLLNILDLSTFVFIDHVGSIVFCRNKFIMEKDSCDISELKKFKIDTICRINFKFPKNLHQNLISFEKIKQNLIFIDENENLMSIKPLFKKKYIYIFKIFDWYFLRLIHRIYKKKNILKKKKDDDNLNATNEGLYDLFLKYSIK